ncbi:MAG: cell division ATP-binding protein FtsE [Turicibacter sp.]|nr:cell division ATP-binding protein FtsE [Turicibacter sp.]
MIEFINVSKKYANGVIGLHNINIQIGSGEFLFIIGPSGAGKSSLLKMINRQEKATGGQLVVKGVDITQMSRFKVPQLRRQIGVVFQDFKLLQKMTVYQNVAFALEAIGLPSNEVREKAVAAIELVGLKNKMRFYPNQLSGGEQQRVAIARAIANNPDIIIADEPTGNLDPHNSEQIVNILKKLNAEGKTIIMATHDHELIFEQDCRVITIDHGTIFSDEVRGYYGNN